MWFPHWILRYNDILDKEEFVRQKVRLNLNDISILEEGYIYCDEGRKLCMKAFIGHDKITFYALDITFSDFRMIELRLLNDQVFDYKKLIQSFYN